MKKKLIATLVAGAVLSTGLIGLTACGNKTVKMPSGEEVKDEEAWIQAFEDTAKLENYTYETSTSVDMKLDGTVSKLSVNGTSKISSYYTLLLDTKNNKAYTESTGSTEAKGTADDEKMDSKASGTSKYYYELKEESDLYNTYWVAKYSKSEEKSTYGVENEESYWQASTTSYLPTAGFSGMLERLYEDKDGKEGAKTVVQLYDKFTYSGGVYTATLYLSAELSYGISENVECEVKVSISGGHVSGLSYKVNKATGNIKEEDVCDLNYTYSAEMVYAITNVDSTDVSKKASKDINNAIDKAKKAEEKLKDLVD